MRLATTLATCCILLSSCVVDPSANNHGYGFDYDSVTELGIKLRDDTGKDHKLADYVDRTALETLECVRGVIHLQADAVVGWGNLQIIIVPDVPNARGRHYHEPPLILLQPTVFGYLQASTFRHEYTHFILNQLGLPSGDATDAVNVCTY